jgi:hypothetical protein
MSDAKLVSPAVRVMMADGSTLELQTANPDLVLWDRTSVKKRWPTFQQANFLWLTFIAWAAARRTGAIGADFTYEKWEAEALQVEVLDDSDDGSAGGPTQPGVDPG